jgi:hypothetical protein
LGLCLFHGLGANAFNKSLTGRVLYREVLLVTDALQPVLSGSGYSPLMETAALPAVRTGRSSGAVVATTFAQWHDHQYQAWNQRADRIEHRDRHMSSASRGGPSARGGHRASVLNGAY